MSKRSKVPARKTGFTDGHGHGAFKHVAPPARLEDVLRSHGHTLKSIEKLRQTLEREIRGGSHAAAG